LTYLAYLDEFGHVGPFISRTDPRHNGSPVFGLAGFVLPSDRVRAFGTWFFKRKCELLKFEIEKAAAHPAVWEKKGASLYTANNIKNYPELRHFTFRLFNKISKMDGFIFYVGMKKTATPAAHKPMQMYMNQLREAIKRIDEFCKVNRNGDDNFLLILDEHEQRSEMITQAARSMYGVKTPRRYLIEPAFHLESHRYQTMQAADWIAGLVGRLGAIWVKPAEYADNKSFRKYFEHRLNAVSIRSGIRN